MYFTIYKTTCTANGKYYIGQHQTEDLEDGYLGSGKHLKRAIKKHGRESFTKEILFVLDSFEAMDAKEAELITREVLADPLCMNHAYGGNAGNFQKLNENGLNNSAGQNLKGNQAFKAKFEDPEFASAWSKKASEQLTRQHREGTRTLTVPDWTGKAHSESTKQKMRDSHVGKHDGAANSQHGTCWVNRAGETKKIRLEHLDHALSEGWVRGRKPPG